MSKTAGLKISILGTLALLCALLLAYGYFSFPVPLEDSIVYLPPAINFCAGKGLINEVFPIAKVLDPLGQGRLIYNVPLFPWLLGKLMWQPTPQNAFFVISLLNSLSLCLSGFLFYHAATIRSRINFCSTFLIMASLAGQQTLFTAHYGARPEILAILFVLLGITALILTSFRFQVPILGLALGCLGATHPSAAIIFAILIAFYFSFAKSGLSLILHLAGIYILSIISFTVLLILSPFPIKDILTGTLKHYRLIMQHLPAKTDWISYLTYANSTFYSVLILLSVLLGLLFFFKSQKNLRYPRQSFAFLFLLILVLFKLSFFSTRIGPAFLFSPLCFSFLIYFLTQTGSRSLWFQWPVFFVIALTSVGAIRYGLLFPFYLSKGMSLESARDHFREIEKQHPESRFGITDPLWVLSENYDRFTYCQYLRERECHAKPEKFFLFWQQNGEGSLMPRPEINHLPLKENFYSSEVPRLFGIKLAHTMPGYFFAVYCGEVAESLKKN